MGFERRGNYEYFYSGVKINRRTVKVYMGGGLEGALAAEAAAATREERRARHHRETRERSEYEQLDAELADFDNMVTKVRSAVLVAAGCGNLAGLWRWRCGCQ